MFLLDHTGKEVALGQLTERMTKSRHVDRVLVTENSVSVRGVETEGREAENESDHGRGTVEEANQGNEEEVDQTNVKTGN